MKKINKKDLIIYTTTLVITMIIFLPLLAGHYASDSYNISNIGYQEYAIKYSLNDGRIFMAILGLLAGLINIPIETYIFVTLFLALIISNITVLVLNNIIKKYKEPKNIFQEIVLIIISYITIFNFMYLENMYFVECIVMAASVLLFIISANMVVEKNKKYILKASVLTILGTMFYQGTIGIFFAFVFLFSILKNANNIKQVAIDFTQGIVVAAIGVISNLVMVKIVGKILNMDQSRYGSLSNIPENISYIISTLDIIMKNNCGLFPKYGLIIFISILTVITIIYQFKNIKKEDNTIFEFIAIVLMTIASSYVVNLMTLASFNSGRLKNSLGALIGIIFIFLYVRTNIFENKGKLNKITLLTLLAFTIMNIVNYENLIFIHKRTNELEKLDVQKLDEYIAQYEEENEIKVTKITKVRIFENTKKGFFDGITNRSIFAHNSMRVNWAADGIINLYTKRDLETISTTQQEREGYYELMLYSDRGYECIGDVLFITTYIN